MSETREEMLEMAQKEYEDLVSLLQDEYKIDVRSEDVKTIVDHINDEKKKLDESLTEDMEDDAKKEIEENINKLTNTLKLLDEFVMKQAQIESLKVPEETTHADDKIADDEKIPDRTEEIHEETVEHVEEAVDYTTKIEQLLSLLETEDVNDNKKTMLYASYINRACDIYMMMLERGETGENMENIYTKIMTAKEKFRIKLSLISNDIKEQILKLPPMSGYCIFNINDGTLTPLTKPDDIPLENDEEEEEEDSSDMSA